MSAAKWIERYRPNPEAKLRLFCFPYAGGPAQAYRSWLDLLPAGLEVCPIQLPGHWTRLREPPFRRISPLVQAATAALRQDMDRPFALLGHSLGGLVAFEVARELRRLGATPPLQLFISSRHAPQLERNDPKLHALPDSEFIAKIRQTYDGIPPEVLDNPDLLELLLPTMRADMEVFDTYAYVEQPPLEVPISVFGGTEDAAAREDELEGWRVQTASRFRLQMFAGKHFFFNGPARQPFFASLADELSQLLASLG